MTAEELRQRLGELLHRQPELALAEVFLDDTGPSGWDVPAVSAVEAHGHGVALVVPAGIFGAEVDW